MNKPYKTVADNATPLPIEQLDRLTCRAIGDAAMVNCSGNVWQALGALSVMLEMALKGGQAWKDARQLALAAVDQQQQGEES